MFYYRYRQIITDNLPYSQVQTRHVQQNVASLNLFVFSTLKIDKEVVKKYPVTFLVSFKTVI